jgi:hypothetical protein
MSQPLLEGKFTDAVSVSSEEFYALQKRIERLVSELDSAKRDRGVWQNKAMKANRSLSAVKNQLLPFYEAMKVLFDELEDVEAGGSSPQSGKWELIKQRLTAKQGAIIDLLNVQGSMTTSQIAAATRSSGESARQMMDKLRQQGLVEKNGTMFTLKER